MPNAVHAPTSSSSSAMFSPRPWWVAKRGSVASSGRPIASHSRPNTLSALAATTTSAPSPVGYTFDGATPGSTLPERVRVTPPSSKSAIVDSISAATAS